MQEVANQIEKLVYNLQLATEIEQDREYEHIKNVFFNNISHELRTPLSIIMMSLQMLELNQASLGEENIKYIKPLKQNCQRLSRTINNLLELTKIDMGDLDVKLTKCNIVSIIEDIVQAVTPYVELKGRIVRFDTEFEEKYIYCDVDKVESIILNLLANATKFTSNGDQIQVNIWEEKDKWVLVSVKDSGQGIPENQKQAIFKHFRQTDNKLNRMHEGSGIGLTLAQAFADIQGGSISVESEEGKGSEFILKLPIRTLVDESMKIEYHKESIVNKVEIEFSDIYS